ncbi:MAG: ADOP family duplicated permease [Gemmatimonadota bacterium]
MSRSTVAFRLLRRLLPGPMGDEAIDALAERYRARRLRSGPMRASAWLWLQVAHPDTVRLSRLLRRRYRRDLESLTVPAHGRFGALGWHARTGMRGLVRRPGLTASIVVTLALGIGANTAVFSVIDGVLLEPLPFPDGEQLAYVWGVTEGDDTELLSGPQAAEVMASEAFEAATMIFGYVGTSMVRDATPEPLLTLTVQHRFFDVLGVAPLLGRGFVAGDEFKLTNEQMRDPDFVRPVGAMVLRYGAWIDRFGGDPSVLGQIVEVSGHRQQIVGVMPPGFRAHLPAELGETEPEDVWIMSPFDQPSFPRDTRFVRAIGRVPEGRDLSSVQDELDRVSAWQRATFGEDARDDFHLRVTWLQSETGSTARGPLALLLTAVGFVLLIACANVATLLLVRASEREEELGVRRALGASRAQLALLALSESVLVATLGGMLGIALAPALTTLLVDLAPAELPRLDMVGVDRSVLAFTALVTLSVAFVTGSLPALRSAVAAPPGAGARLSGSRRERRTGSVLVGIEVTLAVVLVTGTGLLLRSLGNTFSVDPGFRTADVFVWEANLTTPSHPTWPSRAQYFREVQERMLTEPGVRAVGVMTPAPLTGVERSEVRVGMGEDASTVLADFRRTGPGAIEALGIDLREGRTLTWTDLEDFDRLYAVVDERFARRAWPTESALGQVISMERREYGAGSEIYDEWKRIEVVGVVESIRGRDVREDDLPTVYVSYAQNMWGRPVFVTHSDVPLPSSVVRQHAAVVDARPLITDVASLDTIAMARLGALRFALTLVGAFAGLGLLLASTGVYGVLSYAVGRRERELNIRAALGADGARLSWEVVRSALAITASGLLVGWLAAGLLTRFIRTLLFDVSPLDPLTYLGVGVALLTVAGSAAWLPARRAWRRDPGGGPAVTQGSRPTGSIRPVASSIVKSRLSPSM